MVVVEGELEGGEEAGVFGVVVGADTEELGEFGDDVALGISDFGSVACGTGIAAGTTVAVGGDPVGLGGGFWGGSVGEEAGFGRAGGHWESLPEVVGKGVTVGRKIRADKHDLVWVVSGSSGLTVEGGRDRVP